MLRSKRKEQKTEYDHLKRRYNKFLNFVLKKLNLEINVKKIVYINIKSI